MSPDHHSTTPEREVQRNLFSQMSESVSRAVGAPVFTVPVEYSSRTIMAYLDPSDDPGVAQRKVVAANYIPPECWVEIQSQQPSAKKYQAIVSVPGFGSFISVIIGGDESSGSFSITTAPLNLDNLHQNGLDYGFYFDHVKSAEHKAAEIEHAASFTVGEDARRLNMTIAYHRATDKLQKLFQSVAKQVSTR